LSTSSFLLLPHPPCISRQPRARLRQRLLLFPIITNISRHAAANVHAQTTLAFPRGSTSIALCSSARLHRLGPPLEPNFSRTSTCCLLALSQRQRTRQQQHCHMVHHLWNFFTTCNNPRGFRCATIPDAPEFVLTCPFVTTAVALSPFHKVNRTSHLSIVLQSAQHRLVSLPQHHVIAGSSHGQIAGQI
jgi:hypothetical protein